jgi:hypothetical protein
MTLKIQNISTIVTLTNAEKSEKYSNDVRSDLDLGSILPTSLPALTLNETSPPSSIPALPPPPASIKSNEEDQEAGASDDDSNSNSDEEE